jgi:hypothetical protein
MCVFVNLFVCMCVKVCVWVSVEGPVIQLVTRNVKVKNNWPLALADHLHS